jgi:uncharacterized lipoprotein YddW (UPF0748 family)
MPGPGAQRRRRLALAGLAGGAAMLAGCAWRVPGAPPVEPPPVPGLPPEQQPPAAPRELRGAWVATVANIDWPSRPGLAAADQRAEALALLDRAAALGLNALMLQVRPAADAIYPSALEPWSEYLTGAQGQPPDDGYDPLAFWVDQAHRRGLQLHAWFNPYRARHASARTPLAPGHIAQRQPELARRYGDMLWLDPAEPAAAAHTQAVVEDVLTRYDIDGVHIDDYFYPYPVTLPGPAGGEQAFPDDARWALYLTEGGQLSRADWRRRQVDDLVQSLHSLVRRVRPQAQFGISPFGLPQPAFRPPGITGFSQYDKLYADVERWLREGWMDYVAPQLYWPLDRTAQAFEVLLDAWIGLNPRGLGLWPGLYTSMVGSASRPWPADELLEQVARVRQRPAAGGHIHFSLIALAQDRDGLATRLRAGPYAQPALAPAWWPPGTTPQPPAPPQVQPSRGDAAVFRLSPGRAPGAAVALWAVWRRAGGQWRFATQAAERRELALDGADRLVVSAVARNGLESARRLVHRSPA